MLNHTKAKAELRQANTSLSLCSLILVDLDTLAFFMAGRATMTKGAIA